jgi:hypothetical protein
MKVSISEGILNLVEQLLTLDRYGVKLLHRYLDLRTHFTAHLGHCSMRDKFSLLHQSYSGFLLKKTFSSLQGALPVICTYAGINLPAGSVLERRGDELYL